MEREMNLSGRTAFLIGFGILLLVVVQGNLARGETYSSDVFTGREHYDESIYYVFNIDLGLVFPVIGDINNDGREDIVYAAGENLHIYDATNGRSIDGTIDYGKSTHSVVIGNVDDNDNCYNDIIVFQDSMVIIASYWNEYINQVGVIEVENVSGGCLVDVDGDDIMEIVVTAENAVLTYQYNGTGYDVLWNYTANGTARLPFASDLDGDGVVEVGFYSDEGCIYSLNGANGSLQWFGNVGGSIDGEISLGDVDGGADVEIFFSSGGSIFCMNGSDGSIIWQEPYVVGSNIVVSYPCNGLWDVSGVLFSCNDRIYCLDARTGSQLWVSDSTPQPLSISLQDVNGDGVSDIYYRNNEGSYYIDGNTGGGVQFCFGIAKVWKGIREIFPDLDGDGCSELVYMEINPFTKSNIFGLYIKGIKGQSWARPGPWPSSGGSSLKTCTLFDGDSDRLSDDLERSIGTNVTCNDTDGDTFMDGWEVMNGFDPFNATSPGPVPVLDCWSTSTMVNGMEVFHFMTNYSNSLNIFPAEIEFVVNGSGFPMMKYEPGDENCIDGCLYEYCTLLNDGVYDVYSRTKLGSSNNFTVEVSNTSYYTPLLLDPSHSPDIGLMDDTLYTFRINYYQLAGGEPDYVKLIVDGTQGGSEGIMMEKSNPDDDYTCDGIEYRVSTTLPFGSMQYYFTVFDGVLSANSSWYSCPTVQYFKDTWNQTWDGNVQNNGTDIWGDGTFIYTTGYTNVINYDDDLVLVKWDLEGNEVWNRTWGGSRKEHGMGIWGDGTFIYTTGYTDIDSGNNDLVLVKWDLEGNEVWNRTWGGSKDDYGMDVWCDGTSIYTTGYTNVINYEDDLVLVKWDQNGNQVWNRTWGGSRRDHGMGVWGDGTFIYTTGHASIMNYNDDLVLVKWDPDGNQVWNRTWDDSDKYGYGVTSNDYGEDIWGDGTSIYTTGHTSRGDNEDLVLVKWDLEGNQEWNRTWGCSFTDYGGIYRDYGMGVWGNSTSIYTTGYTDLDETDAFILVKWNPDGNQEWNRTWAFNEHNYGMGIWCDEDSLFVVGSVVDDAVVMRLDLVPLLSLESPEAGSAVYNGLTTFVWRYYDPGNSVVNFTWRLSSNPDFSVVLDEVMLVNVNPGVGSISTDVYVNQPAGVYYWSIVTPAGGGGSGGGNISASSMVTIKLNDHAPVLGVPGADPVGGDDSGMFEFSILYSDADGSFPHDISVVIDGLLHEMVKVNVSDDDYVSGCLYHYIGQLAVGEYEYYVQAMDGRFSVSTGVYPVIHDVLVVNFTYNPGVPLENQTISFVDSSTSVVFPVVSWSWDFGDGAGNATGSNVSHVYASGGVYNVTLIASTSDNLTRACILQVHVLDSFGDDDGDLLNNSAELALGLDPFCNDTDTDGLIDGDEVHVHFTNPLSNDSDSDGLIDGDEIANYTTNPLLNDTDVDGLLDGNEVLVHLTDPLSNDTDADGLLDGNEVLVHLTDPLSNDTDSDGLLDGDELFIHFTDPLSNDTDADGMPDGWEVAFGFDALDGADGALDDDDDGLENVLECWYGTNPLCNDTDGDGMPDGWECVYELDPFVDDTFDDADNDTLVNLLELEYGTNPREPDTDDDMLDDWHEVALYMTNPVDADTDGDGMPDGWEVASGLNATFVDAG
ncbi:MAG: PKD domain-containing protein, partial [Promethearchaeota archaeon]